MATDWNSLRTIGKKMEDEEEKAAKNAVSSAPVTTKLNPTKLTKKEKEDEDDAFSLENISLETIRDLNNPEADALGAELNGVRALNALITSGAQRRFNEADKAARYEAASYLEETDIRSNGYTDEEWKNRTSYLGDETNIEKYGDYQHYLMGIYTDEYATRRSKEIDAQVKLLDEAIGKVDERLFYSGLAGRKELNAEKDELEARKKALLEEQADVNAYSETAYANNGYRDTDGSMKTYGGNVTLLQEDIAERTRVREAQTEANKAELAYMSYIANNGIKDQDKVRELLDNAQATKQNAELLVDKYISMYNVVSKAKRDGLDYDAIMAEASKWRDQASQIESMIAGGDKNVNSASYQQFLANADALEKAATAYLPKETLQERYDKATDRVNELEALLEGAQRTMQTGDYRDWNDGDFNPSVYAPEFIAATKNVEFITKQLNEAKQTQAALGAAIATQTAQDFEKKIANDKNTELTKAYSDFIESLTESKPYVDAHGNTSLAGTSNLYASDFKAALKKAGYSDTEIADIIEYNTRAVNELKAAETDKNVKRFVEATFGSGVATIASVATNLASGIGVVEGLRMKYHNDSHYTNMDVNAGVLAPQRVTNSIREAVQEVGNMNANMFGKNVDLFDELYGVLTSSADSIAAAYLGGAIGSYVIAPVAGALSTGVGAAMGTFLGESVAAANAAGAVAGAINTLGSLSSTVLGSSVIGVAAGVEKMVDLTERGASVDQALTGGIVAGVFETLFESVSISQFEFMSEIENVTGLKDIANNMLKSFIGNGSEEFATELANVIYDYTHNYEYSDFKRAYDNYYQNYLDYIADPMKTAEENAAEAEIYAKKMASKDTAEQVLKAGLTGALQGILMGGGGILRTRIAQNYTFREANQVIDTDYKDMNNGDLRNHYKESVSAYRSIYENLAELQEEGRLTNAQADMLARAEQHMKDVSAELASRDVHAVVEQQGKIEGDGKYVTISYGDEYEDLRYNGETKNGRPNGEGTSWGRNGNISWGKWEDGKLIDGVIFLPDGTYRLVEQNEDGVQVSDAMPLTVKSTYNVGAVLADRETGKVNIRNAVEDGKLFLASKRLDLLKIVDADPGKTVYVSEATEETEPKAQRGRPAKRGVDVSAEEFEDQPRQQNADMAEKTAEEAGKTTSDGEYNKSEALTGNETVEELEARREVLNNRYLELAGQRGSRAYNNLSPQQRAALDTEYETLKAELNDIDAALKNKKEDIGNGRGEANGYARDDGSGRDALRSGLGEAGEGADARAESVAGTNEIALEDGRPLPEASAEAREGRVKQKLIEEKADLNADDFLDASSKDFDASISESRAEGFPVLIMSDAAAERIGYSTRTVYNPDGSTSIILTESDAKSDSPIFHEKIHFRLHFDEKLARYIVSNADTIFDLNGIFENQMIVAGKDLKTGKRFERKANNTREYIKAIADQYNISLLGGYENLSIREKVKIIDEVLAIAYTNYFNNKYETGDTLFRDFDEIIDVIYDSDDYDAFVDSLKNDSVKKNALDWAIVVNESERRAEKSSSKAEEGAVPSQEGSEAEGDTETAERIKALKDEYEAREADVKEAMKSFDIRAIAAARAAADNAKRAYERARRGEGEASTFLTMQAEQNYRAAVIDAKKYVDGGRSNPMLLQSLHNRGYTLDINDNLVLNPAAFSIVEGGKDAFDKGYSEAMKIASKIVKDGMPYSWLDLRRAMNRRGLSFLSESVIGKRINVGLSQHANVRVPYFYYEGKRNSDAISDPFSGVMAETFGQMEKNTKAKILHDYFALGEDNQSVYSRRRAALYDVVKNCAYQDALDQLYKSIESNETLLVYDPGYKYTGIDVGNSLKEIHLRSNGKWVNGGVELMDVVIGQLYRYLNGYDTGIIVTSDTVDYTGNRGVDVDVELAKELMQPMSETVEEDEEEASPEPMDVLTYGLDEARRMAQTKLGQKETRSFGDPVYNAAMAEMLGISEAELDTIMGTGLEFDDLHGEEASFGIFGKNSGGGVLFQFDASDNPLYLQRKMQKVSADDWQRFFASEIQQVGDFGRLFWSSEQTGKKIATSRGSAKNFNSNARALILSDLINELKDGKWSYIDIGTNPRLAISVLSEITRKLDNDIGREMNIREDFMEQELVPDYVFNASRDLETAIDFDKFYESDVILKSFEENGGLTADVFHMLGAKDGNAALEAYNELTEARAQYNRDFAEWRAKNPDAATFWSGKPSEEAKKVIADFNASVTAANKLKEQIGTSRLYHFTEQEREILNGQFEITLEENGLPVKTTLAAALEKQDLTIMMLQTRESELDLEIGKIEDELPAKRKQLETTDDEEKRRVLEAQIQSDLDTIEELKFKKKRTQLGLEGSKRRYEVLRRGIDAYVEPIIRVLNDSAKQQSVLDATDDKTADMFKTVMDQNGIVYFYTPKNVSAESGDTRTKGRNSIGVTSYEFAHDLYASSPYFLYMGENEFWNSPSVKLFESIAESITPRERRPGDESFYSDKEFAGKKTIGIDTYGNPITEATTATGADIARERYQTGVKDNTVRLVSEYLKNPDAVRTSILDAFDRMIQSAMTDNDRNDAVKAKAEAEKALEQIAENVVKGEDLSDMLWWHDRFTSTYTIAALAWFDRNRGMLDEDLEGRVDKTLTQELREQQYSDDELARELFQYMRPESSVSIKELNQLRKYIRENYEIMFNMHDSIWTDGEWGTKTANITKIIDSRKGKSIYERIPGLDQFEIVLGRPANSMFSNNVEVRAYDDQDGNPIRQIVIDRDADWRDQNASLLFAIQLLECYQRPDGNFEIPADPIKFYGSEKAFQRETSGEDGTVISRLHALLAAGIEKGVDKKYADVIRKAIDSGNAYDYLNDYIRSRKTYKEREAFRSFLFEGRKGSEEIFKLEGSNDTVKGLFNRLKNLSGVKDANDLYAYAARLYARQGFKVPSSVQDAKRVMLQNTVNYLLSDSVVNKVNPYGATLGDVIRAIRGQTDENLLTEEQFTKLFNGEAVDGLSVWTVDYGTRYAKDKAKYDKVHPLTSRKGTYEDATDWKKSNSPIRRFWSNLNAGIKNYDGEYKAILQEAVDAKSAETFEKLREAINSDDALRDLVFGFKNVSSGRTSTENLFKYLNQLYENKDAQAEYERKNAKLIRFYANDRDIALKPDENSPGAQYRGALREWFANGMKGEAPNPRVQLDVGGDATKQFVNAILLTIQFSDAEERKIRHYLNEGKYRELADMFKEAFAGETDKERYEAYKRSYYDNGIKSRYEVAGRRLASVAQYISNITKENYTVDQLLDEITPEEAPAAAVEPVEEKGKDAAAPTETSDRSEKKAPKKGFGIDAKQKDIRIFDHNLSVSTVDFLNRAADGTVPTSAADGYARYMDVQRRLFEEVQANLGRPNSAVFYEQFTTLTDQRQMQLKYILNTFANLLDAYSGSEGMSDRLFEYMYGLYEDNLVYGKDGILDIFRPQSWATINGEDNITVLQETGTDTTLNREIYSTAERLGYADALAEAVAKYDSYELAHKFYMNVYNLASINGSNIYGTNDWINCIVEESYAELQELFDDADAFINSVRANPVSIILQPENVQRLYYAYTYATNIIKPNVRVRLAESDRYSDVALTVSEICKRNPKVEWRIVEQASGDEILAMLCAVTNEELMNSLSENGKRNYDSFVQLVLSDDTLGKNIADAWRDFVEVRSAKDLIGSNEVTLSNGESVSIKNLIEFYFGDRGSEARQMYESYGLMVDLIDPSIMQKSDTLLSAVDAARASLRSNYFSLLSFGADEKQTAAEEKLDKELARDASLVSVANRLDLGASAEAIDVSMLPEVLMKNSIAFADDADFKTSYIQAVQNKFEELRKSLDKQAKTIKGKYADYDQTMLAVNLYNNLLRLAYASRSAENQYSDDPGAPGYLNVAEQIRDFIAARTQNAYLSEQLMESYMRAHPDYLATQLERKLNAFARVNFLDADYMKEAGEISQYYELLGLDESDFVEYRNLLLDGDVKKTKKFFESMMQKAGSSVHSNYDLWKKFKSEAVAWRYAAMLSNPTTHANNIASTLANLANNNMATVAQWGLERAMIKAGKMDVSDATAAPVSMLTDKALYEKGAENYEIAKQYIYDKNRLGSMISEAVKKSGSKIAIVNPITKALEKEDEWMGTMIYRQQFASVLKARRIAAEDFDSLPDTQKSQIRAIAADRTQTILFRNISTLSKMLGNLNNTRLGHALMAPVLPFVNIAGNLATTAVETSFIGAFGAAWDAYMYNLAKNVAVDENGDVIADTAFKKALYETALRVENRMDLNPASAKAQIARKASLATIGTLGMVLGFVGRMFGFITGGDEPDDDLDRLRKANGYQAYSLVIPFNGKEYYVSLGRYFPANFSLLLGAKIADCIDRGEYHFMETFTETFADNVFIGNIFNSIERLSQSIGSITQEEYSNTGAKIMAILASSGMTHLQNYATQFVPGLLKTIENIFFEENKDMFFYDKNSDVPYSLQYLISDISDAIPGWDYNRTEKRDMYGDPTKHETIVDYMIRVLAGQYSEKKDRVYDEWLTELAETSDPNSKTGTYANRVIFEDVEKSRRVDNQRLTDEEYSEYNRILSSMRDNIYTALTYNETFQNATPEEKALVIEYMNTMANQAATSRVRDMRGREPNESFYGDDLIGKGNIDLHNLQPILDEDGNYMTTYSYTIRDGGEYVNIPGVIDVNGERVAVNEEDARRHYEETGEYFGKFDTAFEAEVAADALHLEQEAFYHLTQSDLAAMMDIADKTSDFADYALLKTATMFTNSDNYDPDFELLEKLMDNFDGYSPLVQNTILMNKKFADIYEAYKAEVPAEEYYNLNKAFDANDLDELTKLILGVSDGTLKYYENEEGAAFRKVKEAVDAGYDLKEYDYARKKMNALFTGGATDEEIEEYENLRKAEDAKGNDDLLDLISTQYEHEKLKTANDAGYETKTYFTVYDKYKELNNLDDLSAGDKKDLFTTYLRKTFKNESDVAFFEDMFKFYNMFPAKDTTKDKFTDYGFTDASARYVVDLFDGLEPINGYKSVRDCQKVVALNNAFANGDLKDLGWDKKTWENFLYDFMAEAYSKGAEAFKEKYKTYAEAYDYYLDLYGKQNK